MSEALAYPRSSASRRSASVQEVAELLHRYDNILIVSHHRPDGDCLGSTVGLFLGLQSLGKRVAAYNHTPLNFRWDFLPGIENVRNALPEWNVDLTVFVDCGAIYRVSDDFQPIGATINIDHHLTNDQFADYNWIDVESCAVGEQIHALLGEMKVPVTKEIASALYLAIMTDTGGFRYSNTSARSFRIAGELVAAGAEPGELAQAVYETRSRGEVALTGHVYSNLHYEMDGLMVWAELRQADYAREGGTESEPEGLSSEMRGVRGVEVSCLLHETEEGQLRANFRGKGRVDCSSVAIACGGGGHFNASGATIRDLPYEQAREKVLNELRKAVRAYQESKTKAGKG